MERNEDIKKTVDQNPTIQFYPESNIENFLSQEKLGVIGGKLMNTLIHGVVTIYHDPEYGSAIKVDSLSDFVFYRSNNDSVLSLDSIYTVPEKEKFNVFNYDTIFHYPVTN